MSQYGGLTQVLWGLGSWARDEGGVANAVRAREGDLEHAGRREREEYNQDVNIITSHKQLGAADGWGGVTQETSEPSNSENIPVTKYQSVSSFQFLNLTEEMHFEVVKFRNSHPQRREVMDANSNSMLTCASCITPCQLSNSQCSSSFQWRKASSWIFPPCQNCAGLFLHPYMVFKISRRNKFLFAATCTNFIFIINSNVWRAQDAQRGWCCPLIGQMTLILAADWLILWGPVCNVDVMAFMLTIMHINIIKSLVELSQMAVGHLVTVYLHQLLDFLPNYSIVQITEMIRLTTLGDRQVSIQEGF